MDERARRIGENEILYRSVNERIEELNETLGTIAESMSVVCECGELQCAQQIHISVPDYERVRADATWFVIVPGHDIPDVEDVVEEHADFHVVRKHSGEAAQLAAAEDPRS